MRQQDSQIIFKGQGSLLVIVSSRNCVRSTRPISTCFPLITASLSFGSSRERDSSRAYQFNLVCWQHNHGLSWIRRSTLDILPLQTHCFSASWVNTMKLRSRCLQQGKSFLWRQEGLWGKSILKSRFYDLQTLFHERANTCMYRKRTWPFAGRILRPAASADSSSTNPSMTLRSFSVGGEVPASL